MRPRLRLGQYSSKRSQVFTSEAPQTQSVSHSVSQSGTIITRFGHQLIILGVVQILISIFFRNRGCNKNDSFYRIIVLIHGLIDSVIFVVNMAPITLVPTFQPPMPSSLRKLSEHERINLLVRMNNFDDKKTQGSCC